MAETIEQMIQNRRLERVPPNRPHALRVIHVAEQHVRTAQVLAKTEDQAMAFTAAYDAVRKSLAAVLTVEGLRARPVGGAHRDTGVAAALLVAEQQMAGEYDEFDTFPPSSTVSDVLDA